MNQCIHHLHSAIRLLVFFILLHHCPIYSEPQKIKLEWQKVPAAKWYIMEVKDSRGDRIFKEKVDALFIEIELEIGEYEKKLIVYNKLDEKILESEWMPLNVVPLYKPEITELQPITIDKFKEYKETSWNGNHFDPNMEVWLRSERYVLQIKGISIANENQFFIHEKLIDLPIGAYDLILKNPQGAETIYPKAITIVDTTPPRNVEKQYEIFKRSVLFPGWGQYYAYTKYGFEGDKTRATIYSSLFLFTGLLSYKYYTDYGLKNRSFDDFKSGNLGMATALLNSDDNTKAGYAIYAISNLQSHQRQLQKIADPFNMAFSILTFTYLINAIDAYFLEDKYFNNPPVKVGFNYNLSTISVYRENYFTFQLYSSF
jgi:hypothetical protein